MPTPRLNEISLLIVINCIYTLYKRTLNQEDPPQRRKPPSSVEVLLNTVRNHPIEAACHSSREEEYSTPRRELIALVPQREIQWCSVDKGLCCAD